METTRENYQPRQEWRDETGELSSSLMSFLSSESALRQDNERYDSMNELHFSGSNVDVLQEIRQGTATPIEIKSYYEDGEIKQIHAVFEGGKTGHNIDVYLTGRALEDYLGVEKKQ